MIIDGEHRWKAAKELGLSKVPVICFPPMPESLAKYITMESNEIHGATKDDAKKSILDDIYSSDDSWVTEESDIDLHTMLVLDPDIVDVDKYGMNDDDLEPDKPQSSPVTIFFSETQKEKFRKIVGQLRLVHGMTQEEAVIHVVEHFEESTGFGIIPKE